MHTGIFRQSSVLRVMTWVGAVVGSVIVIIPDATGIVIIVLAVGSICTVLTAVLSCTAATLRAVSIGRCWVAVIAIAAEVSVESVYERFLIATDKKRVCAADRFEHGDSEGVELVVGRVVADTSCVGDVIGAARSSLEGV